jgi:hypothetical protein
MFNKKRLLKYALMPALAGLALAAVAAIAIRPSSTITSEASSHREAPLISGDPLADATDTYAFISHDASDKLTLVGNWIPFEEPAGGPNFYNFGDDVTYDFDIDNNGDAKTDIVYRFKFNTQVLDPSTFLYATGPIHNLTDSTFNIRQYFDVYRQDGNGPFNLVASHLQTPPNNVGPKSTPNYATTAAQATYSLPGGGKVFAGQRDDPFFVDLGAVFDLATIRQLPGNAGGGIDGLGGFNVNSIVLQVPIASVTKCACDPATKDDPAAVVGVWTETYRQQVRVLDKHAATAKGNGHDGPVTNNGPLVQVSRLGNPLVNEVVIPLSNKDKFNASEPQDDGQFLPFVLNSDLASKLNALYGFGLPTTGRTDLATVFLTGIPGLTQPPNVVGSEELRVNLGIKPNNAGCASASALGVIGGDICGFPNGRRLADDVTDIELRAVACGYGFNLGPCDNSAAYAATTTKLGDGVDGNDVQFSTSFPYEATPHQGFEHEHHTGVVVPPLFAGLGGSAVMLGLLIVGTQVFGLIRRRRKAVTAGDQVA